MTGLNRALRAICGFLESQGYPHMVIGGIANLVWGVPRSTLDIDVTVWVPEREERGFIEEVTAAHASLVQAPGEFAARTRVLPLRVEGFKVDLILGGLPYEESAIRRARVVDMGGFSVRVCAPEDLIVYKIISERPKDLEDVRGVIASCGLDRKYLDPIIEGLAQDLGRPEIQERYRQAWAAKS